MAASDTSERRVVATMHQSWAASTRGTSGTFSLGFVFDASRSAVAAAVAARPPLGAPRLAAEIAALAAIFRLTGGEGAWKRHDGWSAASAPSRAPWFGVTVAAASGRVTSLSLTNNGLDGRLSDLVPHVRALPALTELRLGGNALRGFLPPALACTDAMPSLAVLDVSRNRLVGTTPRQFAERSRDFEWRDCTGNELSVFYRATEAVYDAEREAEREAERGGADGGADARAPVDPAGARGPVAIGALESSAHVDGAAAARGIAGHALGAVHLTEGVLSGPDCARIVALAEAHAAAHGGWRSDRHTMYRTTDVDVRDVPSLLALLNARLRTRIMPTIAARFGVAATDLVLEDLFVAKYSVPPSGAPAGASPDGGVGREAKRRKFEGGGEREAGGGAQRHQAALAAHRDDSELSFVLLLNDADAFEGGGTEFLDWSPPFVAAPRERGTMASFCGLQRHAGRAIRSGTRFILAGFVRVFDDGRVVRSEGNRIFPPAVEE